MTTRSAASSLASMAAALAFSAGALAADAPQGSMGAAVAAGDKVHCYGINACKGKAECKTAANDCKGMNACKGKGFKAMSAKACLNQGGTIGDLSGK
ncbi:MAG: hypothetical protein AMJ64_13990 [Betaproteobacteria bacterium SG8_39]|nr:MAG: hypothetical protein AMJ64_13990 [Betaproteobacteria bacterium SG8_39]